MDTDHPPGKPYINVSMHIYDQRYTDWRYMDNHSCPLDDTNGSSEADKNSSNAVPECVDVMQVCFTSPALIVLLKMVTLFSYFFCCRAHRKMERPPTFPMLYRTQINVADGMMHTAVRDRTRQRCTKQYSDPNESKYKIHSSHCHQSSVVIGLIYTFTTRFYLNQPFVNAAIAMYIFFLIR